MRELSRVRAAFLAALATTLVSSAFAQGEKKTDPVGEPSADKARDSAKADASRGEPRSGEAKEAKDGKEAKAAVVQPQKLDPKLFDSALNDFFTGPGPAPAL